jgi:hypothetical protein
MGPRLSDVLWLAYVSCSILPFPIARLLSPRFALRPGVPPARLCRYNHSEAPGSTARDVVFFYASSVDAGLRLSLKSLRSSGSRARVVLFAPRALRPSARDRAALAALRVELLQHPPDGARRAVPHMLRYELELQWLASHAGAVDRVLHSDALDVFFQGDPFARHVRADALTFVVEPQCIRSCGWNLAWVNRCYGEAGMQQMGHRFIICSGSIAGPARDYEALLRLMTAQKEWGSCWGRSLDQPILNWLVWTGAVREAGIRYRLAGCDGGFFTMQWCVLEGNILRNDDNQIVSLEGSVPSYIHQHNRNARFSRDLLQICEL